MSKRSIAVLHRKLRALEDAYVSDTRRALRQMVSELADDLVAPRVGQLVLDELVRMTTRTFDQGVLLLEAFMVENRIGVERDLRAVSANSGVDVEILLHAWQPRRWLYGAAQLFEASLTAVFARTVDQAGKQKALAKMFQEGRDGWKERMFSPTPIARPGRRGVGVLVTAADVMPTTVITPAYGMVSAQRVNLYDQAVELANG